MKEPTHTRKADVITVLATNETTRHPSINTAKRASRQLQKTGSVMKTLPYKSAQAKLLDSLAGR